MATIKAVSSRASIGNAVNYITKDEKTEAKLVSGIGCSPETALDEMMVTKKLWNKTDGRTYKHFVQSFHKDEPVTLEMAHECAMKLAAKIAAWEGYEVLVATHKDKDHIHTHFIVNSVSMENGKKLQWSAADLADMKAKSDELCREYGLSVTVKGKTFEGLDREETSTYTKDAHIVLKQAEEGKVQSYVQNIALAVLEAKETATGRQEFIAMMAEKNIGVEWSDNRKYITFTDLARQEQGEKKCKVRNNKLEQYYNMDFGKEGMERVFESNARREEATREAERAVSEPVAAADTAAGFAQERQFRDGAGAERAERRKREVERRERAAADAERKRQEATERAARAKSQPRKGIGRER